MLELRMERDHRRPTQVREVSDVDVFAVRSVEGGRRRNRVAERPHRRDGLPVFRLVRARPDRAPAARGTRQAAKCTARASVTARGGASAVLRRAPARRRISRRQDDGGRNLECDPRPDTIRHPGGRQSIARQILSEIARGHKGVDDIGIDQPPGQDRHDGPHSLSLDVPQHAGPLVA